MLLTDMSRKAAWDITRPFPFYQIVKRCFAKVGADAQSGEWGFNMLVFDFDTKELTQHCIPSGSQSARFTDLDYDDNVNRLVFVVGGTMTEFPIYEIPEALAENILKPHNWKAMIKGMRNKSPLTAKWLTDRGIYSENERRHPRSLRSARRR